MKSTVEKLEKNLVALHIEVDESELSAAMDQAYKRLVHKVAIPGFRKGHAPRPLLERHVGKEYLLDEALEKLVPDVYAQAILEAGIEPIDHPHIDIEEMVEDKLLKLVAKVEVTPEVILHEYMGIPVERVVERVTDAKVDEVLDHMRDEQAQVVTVDREVVEQGDFALIDFTGFVDGKPFAGGASKNYMLEIGGGRFIPGFEEQVVGMAVGEERVVKTTFPTDYRATNLAGKEAEFQVVLHEIKTRQLPALDDEFAKSLGEFETLADLRKQILSNLESEAKSQAEQQMRSNLVDAAAAAAEVEVAEIQVKREAQRRTYEFGQRLAYQGLDPERFLNADNPEAASLRAELTKQAESAVRHRLVLSAIAAKEGIASAPEEVDAEIERMALGDTAHAEEIRRSYAEPDQRAGLEEAMRLEKVVDFLAENAVIAEKVGDEA